MNCSQDLWRVDVHFLCHFFEQHQELKASAFQAVQLCPENGMAQGSSGDVSWLCCCAGKTVLEGCSIPCAMICYDVFPVRSCHLKKKLDIPLLKSPVLLGLSSQIYLSSGTTSVNAPVHKFRLSNPMVTVLSDRAISKRHQRTNKGQKQPRDSLPGSFIYL